MSTDRIREIEKEIASLQAQLERLKDELEKARELEREVDIKKIE